MSEAEKQPRSSGLVARFLAMPNDSPVKTVLVALILCLVCSVAVSSAAVLLRPAQERNKTLALKKEILQVAGLLKQGQSIEEQFRKVDTRIVDLETGEYLTGIDPNKFDHRKAARNPKTSVKIPPQDDVARIKRRARYAPVYLVWEGEEIRLVIIPVHGSGLWSTMYGLLALEKDTNTVAGITFYEHAETAGLGSEIGNPRWQAQWQDKRIYDTNSNVRFHLVKGSVDESSPEALYRVDALSGATLTSDGVTNLVRYWLGEAGFGKYLSRIRTSEDAT